MTGIGDSCAFHSIEAAREVHSTCHGAVTIRRQDNLPKTLHPRLCADSQLIPQLSGPFDRPEHAGGLVDRLFVLVGGI